jgi:hypothetical protein
VLLIALVTLSLCALAIGAIAAAARLVMRRLGVDLMTTLLFLGLAERPAGRRPPRTRSVERAAPDKPRRRRSPHNRLGRSATRRRPAVS